MPKHKSMEEIILKFQKENIDRIMFKSEGRTPLRFPLAQDLKDGGYIHASEISTVIDKVLKDKYISKTERIKILFDWIEALDLVKEKKERKVTCY